jgi:hypothetical protein
MDEFCATQFLFDKQWWGLHKLNPVDPRRLKGPGFNP